MRIMRLIHRFAAAFVGLVLVASLALNLSMLTVSSVYTAASAALSGLGVTTVAAREAGRTRARRETTRRIGRQTARKVGRRMQRGAARNIASVGGEAIPVVGIAVLAGGLALEVRDACDTAADMAGLEAALATEGDADAEAARRAATENFDCTAMIRETLPDYQKLPTKEDIWARAATAPARAYDRAREAGIAVSEVNWSGKPGEAVSWMLDWVGYLGDWFKDGTEGPAQ